MDFLGDVPLCGCLVLTDNVITERNLRIDTKHNPLGNPIWLDPDQFATKCITIIIFVKNNLGKIPKFYLNLTFHPSPVLTLSLKSESLHVYGSWGIQH